MPPHSPVLAPNRRKVLAVAASGVLAAGVALPRWARAQSNLIRIVVGYPPGGGTDRAARLVGERLQALLGRPVIVENRVGAGGRLAAQQLVNTPADQTTLMIANPAVMSVAPLIYKDLKYDVQKDFVPVAAVTDYDFAVAVSAGLPVREVSHMLAWVRANPEKANAGVPATGSLPHFFALMLSQQAKVKIEVVGYRGSAPLLNDLIGGQVPIAFDTLDSVLPQHLGGKLRVLATSGAARSPFSPNVPTFREQGLPITATGWNTLFAPSTTPKATVELLAATVHKIMQEADIRAKFAAATMVPVAMTQAQTVAMLRAFDAQWAPVIKASGFKPEA